MHRHSAKSFKPTASLPLIAPSLPSIAVMSSQEAKDTPQTGPTQCVGPDYRTESQKPTATVSTEVEYENVITLPQTPQLIALLT